MQILISQMEGGSKTRIVWIDAVKGTGILLVMLSHSCGVPFIGGYLFAGVIPLFFISSGFTMKRENLGRGLAQKWKRLLIPYFFYGFLTAIVMFFRDPSWAYFPKTFSALLYSRYCMFPTGVKDNIDLLGYSYNAPLWFLTAMFCAILWTYLYLEMKAIFKKAICITVYAALTFTCLNIRVLLPWSLDTSFFLALFVIAGLEWRNVYYRFLQRDILSITVLAAAVPLYFILASYNGAVNLSVRIYGSLGYYSVLLCFLTGIMEYGVISVFTKRLDNTGVIRFFSRLGRNSLRLMCIHYPVFVLLNTFFSYVIPGMNFYVASVLEIIFVIGLCFGLEQIIRRYNKRLPLLKWL